MTELQKVTRADLKRFSGEATDLIMWAQEQGCRIKISNRNHAVVLAPDGEGTACVPRNLRLANRAAQNARAGVKRLFKNLEETC